VKLKENRIKDLLSDAVKAKIVVTIPAFNEEKTISKIITRIKKVCNKMPYEYQIIVIDDGSTDKTTQIARKTGAVVLEHYWNRGIVKALKTGFDEALKNDADIIVNMDADGQHRPEDIPKLIRPILDGNADMVLGSRFLRGNVEGMTFTKRVGNRFFSWLVSKITRFPFTDTQTGFRALTCDAAKKIFLHSRYTYTQEMLIQAAMMGLRMKEVPICVNKRKHGKSKLVRNSLSYGLRALTIILCTLLDYRPLMLFGVLGGLMISTGFVLGSFLAIMWLWSGYISNIPLIVLTILLLMTGFQILIFGFVANMFARMRNELLNKQK